MVNASKRVTLSARSLFVAIIVRLAHGGCGWNTRIAALEPNLRDADLAATNSRSKSGTNKEVLAPDIVAT
jgi:hypothetical protein